MFDFEGGQSANLVLNGALQTRRFSHAYLFCGSEFVGKQTVAKKFAMAICCTHPNRRPCFECASCRKITHGNYADYVEFKTSGFFDKVSLSTDEARELISRAFVKPIEGDYKIFVVSYVENLQLAAANVLLKLLEEPPRNVIFMLTAKSRFAVLPTIVSRCALVSVSGIGECRCFESLKNTFSNYNEQTLKKAVEFSEGSLKKAMQLLNDEVWKKALETASELFLAYLQKDELKFLQNVAKINDDLNFVFLVFNFFCVSVLKLIKSRVGCGKEVSFAFCSELSRVVECFERARFLILRNCNLKLVLTNLCSSLFCKR